MKDINRKKLWAMLLCCVLTVIQLPVSALAGEYGAKDFTGEASAETAEFTDGVSETEDFTAPDNSTDGFQPERAEESETTVLTRSAAEIFSDQLDVEEASAGNRLGVEGDGFTFDEDSCELTVNSNDGTLAWQELVNPTAVKTLVIEAKVTEIGSSVFQNCSNLEKVDLSNASKLESIGSSAFFGCSNLQSVIFKNATAPTLEDTTVFPDNSALAIYVPSGAAGYKSENLWPDGKVVIGPALSGLEVHAEGAADALALVPGFYPGIREYEVNVGAAINEITITPTAAENTEVDKITVNGTVILSGVTSGAIPLGNYGIPTVI